MSHFAVIFDMDGVIVDSEPVYAGWNEEMFRQLKITVPDEIKVKLIGGSTRRKWERIKEHCTLSQSIEELVQFQKQFFRDKDYPFHEILFPGVKPLLDELKNNQVPVALASSSNKNRINKVIRDCKIENYFSTVVSGEEFMESKPNPDIFLYAASKLHMQPDKCIVIEDSWNGLTAASRAGMKKIGVRHATIPMDLSSADKIITSLEEINYRKLVELVK
ncbi:HAD family phosphatase [Bacillaceae bacterium Marseille-Q3522]|nr:HAD family phosphatase [Bacillaceae bacterium Marseille-Q3522]